MMGQPPFGKGVCGGTRPRPDDELVCEVIKLPEPITESQCTDRCTAAISEGCLACIVNAFPYFKNIW